MAGWVTLWRAAQAPAADKAEVTVVPLLPETLDDSTVRLMVRLTGVGKRVRVRLSNVFGDLPLRLAAGAISIRATDDRVHTDKTKIVLFGGSPDVTIPARAEVLSDPVELEVSPSADLAISIHFPGGTPLTTVHPYACKTSYIAPGDQVSRAGLENAQPLNSWPILTAIEAEAETGKTLIVIGDSLTDTCEQDSDLRWSDILASRLREAGHHGLTLANSGLGGNRLLHNGFGALGKAMGEGLLARFDRDVIGVAGAAGVIVFIGVNDIGLAQTTIELEGAKIDLGHPEETISSQALIKGLLQVSLRARASGLAVFAATLTPFGGSIFDRPENVAIRKEVNEWLRGPGTGHFDAVFDFDAAVRDQDDMAILAEQFDPGDHLHHTAYGARALAGAIDLNVLARSLGLADGINSPASCS